MDFLRMPGGPLAGDALDEVEALLEALAEAARSRGERRHFFGRGQQAYAAWMLGVCLEAREDLGLRGPLADCLPGRAFALVFGEGAGPLLLEALERQAGAFDEALRLGRASYRGWNGGPRIAYPPAGLSGAPGARGVSGEATSAVGGTIPGPTK